MPPDHPPNVDSRLVNVHSADAWFIPLSGLYEPFRQSFNTLAGWRATEKHLVTTLAAGTGTGIVGGEPFPQTLRYYT